MQKAQWLVSLLSFLLPGLGQIYFNQYKRGVGFFVFFCAALSIKQIQPFILIVSLLSAWDAYRFANRYCPVIRISEKAYTIRGIIFAVVAVLAFLVWNDVLFLRYSNKSNLVQVDKDLKHMTQKLRDCVEKNGRLPSDLNICLPVNTFLKDVMVDPWKKAYRYQVLENGQLQIRSAGVDQKFNTLDDIVLERAF